MLFGVHLVAMTERLDRRLDVIFNEISDLCADGLMFWRQSEINHVLPPYIGSSERVLDSLRLTLVPSCPIVTKVGDSEIPIEPKSRLA